MTPDQFADLQEIFVLVVGPILQWLFVGVAVVVTGLLVLQSGLGLLRRMLGSGPGDRQNL